MSAQKSLDKLRTWIEIDGRAVHRNCDAFRKLIGPRVKLWSVVKSNAYGHGLFAFSKLADRAGADGFCVDSCVEALALRREGIKKPILVLGPTLPPLLKDASREKIAVTVSNFEALKHLLGLSLPPLFHLKFDTGMHRQGFRLSDAPRVIRSAKKIKPRLQGIYTHFASAKDINYPTYTDQQLETFEKVRRLFERNGFSGFLTHAAATGAAMINKKYHKDAVRIGIGLYGLYPSKELELQLRGIRLFPVLSWRTVVSEVKEIPHGGFVGYDLAERVSRATKLAILPIGYWHGFPRSLSSGGIVLINGKPARVLGRVSMDLTAVDATGIRVRVGDRATLIGKNSPIENSAFDVAHRAGTIHYELLTRLNPLIERVVVHG